MVKKSPNISSLQSVIISKMVLFRSAVSNAYGSLTRYFSSHPLPSFFITLGILLLFIIFANILNKPKAVSNQTAGFSKSVSVYKIGSAPKITVPAKIDKTGVIKIVSQNAGIVSSVPVTEGQAVKRGQTLVNLSSNYLGADAASLQVKIAQEQLNNITDTFSIQEDIINKQRNVATQSAQNVEDLRAIGAASTANTQTAINQDQTILNTLSQNLSNYSATNSGGMNDALILQTEELQSQFQNGLNQLQNALNQTQYQTNTTKSPILLANLQQDITLKQLDIQEKTLQMNKEISTLQLNLAYLNESLMHPASPVDGTIQRVLVNAGQAVTPGTPLAIVSADTVDPDVTAVISVPLNLARTVSRIESSILHLGTKDIYLTPRFISQEATDGNLFSVIFSIPQEYQNLVINQGFITVDMPVGVPDTDKTIPFIPLDSIYQTQDEAYIYVVRNGKAVSKTVTLGTVYGRFVQIQEGLSDGDQIILNRNVIAGDKVAIQ